MLASGRLSTRRALFQAILYELGRPYRGMDEGELRLAVVDYLMAGDNNSRGLVLLVDEAHTLPLRLLEEIRLLTNLARSGQPLVRLVMAGGPALEERFASPEARLVQPAVGRPLLPRSPQPHRDQGLHPVADRRRRADEASGSSPRRRVRACFRPPAACPG